MKLFYLKFLLLLSLVVGVSASAQTVVTYNPSSVAFSASNSSSLVTLTGNLGTFTISSGTPGQQIQIEFCQDSIGGHTITQGPSNYTGSISISTLASYCTQWTLFLENSGWRLRQSTIIPPTSSGGGGGGGGTSAVTSIFGRVGAVTATLGDYSFSKISGTVSVPQLPTIPYSQLSGTPTIPTDTGQLSNGAGFITSSTAPVKSVNGNTGIVVLTPSSIGADASGAATTALATAETYSSNAANLTSGTINVSRLPSVPYSILTGVPTFPVTASATSNQWLSSYNSLTGVFTFSQPSFSNISGSLSHGQLPTLLSADIPNNTANTSGQSGTVATISGLITAGSNVTISGSGTSGSPYAISSATTGGSMTWPTGSAGVACYAGSSAWCASYNSGNLIPANFISTIAYSSLSGLPQLPVAPSVTTHNFLNGYNATTGIFSFSQPSFTDISGSLAHAQLPTLLSADIPNNTANTSGQAGTVATISGLVTAGSNVTVTGSGTSGSPFVVNSTATGEASILGIRYGNNSSADTVATATQLNTALTAGSVYYVPTPTDQTNWNAKYGPDAVNNSYILYQAGSGGDSTCALSTSGTQTDCFFSATGFVKRSVNAGAYYTPVDIIASGSNITATQSGHTSTIAFTGTLAATQAPIANNFLTGYTASTGVFTYGQPSFTNISGSLAHSQLPTLLSGDIPANASNTSGQAGTVATISGLISAGSNVVITGSGTSGSPYSIASTGSTTYPGSGIANSTGSAWGTSYTTTGSGTTVALSTSPTFTTSIITPAIYGGASVLSITGNTTGDSIAAIIGSGGGANGTVTIQGGSGSNTATGTVTITGEASTGTTGTVTVVGAASTATSTGTVSLIGSQEASAANGVINISGSTSTSATGNGKVFLTGGAGTGTNSITLNGSQSASSQNGVVQIYGGAGSANGSSSTNLVNITPNFSQQKGFISFNNVQPYTGGQTGAASTRMVIQALEDSNYYTNPIYGELVTYNPTTAASYSLVEHGFEGCQNSSGSWIIIPPCPVTVAHDYFYHYSLTGGANFSVDDTLFNTTNDVAATSVRQFYITTELAKTEVEQTSTVATATTIAPTTPLVLLTGTTAIATITSPFPTISYGSGCFDVIPASTVATTTAGNIFAVYSLIGGKLYRACYVAGSSKWYFSGSGI